MSAYAFTFNGYTFGGVGAAVQLLGVQGLEDSPAVRSSDTARGFADGMFYGRDFLAGRTITIDLEIPAGVGGLRAALDALKAALAPQGGSSTAASPLTFTLPGGSPRRVYARLRRRSLPIDLDYSYGRAKGAVEFYAADPRVYDDAASSVSIGLSGASGGFTFPAAFNISFGTTAAPNTQVATNAGTYSTPLVITIPGPVDTPIIENVTEGKQLKLNLVVAAGDTLTINTDTRAIMLDGTASRYSSLSTGSVWFDLQPGNNTLKFSAAAATTSVASIAWRNAYI